jgi:copper chaperone
MTPVSDPTKQVTLSIEGMSCGHCVRAVKEALSGLRSGKLRDVGIGFAEIDVLSPSAEVDAIAALKDAGYSARATAPSPSSGSQVKHGCCGGPKGCCG